MCDNKIHDGTCCGEITPCPTCRSDDHLHCNGTNLGGQPRPEPIAPSDPHADLIAGARQWLKENKPLKRDEYYSLCESSLAELFAAFYAERRAQEATAPPGEKATV